MRWADDLRIETLEQIDVSLELAGLGSRSVARLIDWGVKALLLAVGGGALFLLLAFAGVDLSSQWIFILWGAVLLGFAVAYDVYFELRSSGQTPGKRRAGIRVIREDGAPLDLRSSCLRNLLFIADYLPILYLLGAFLVLLTPRRQRFGDLAAGTIVIRERSLGAPADPTGVIDRLASVEFLFTADQLVSCLPDGRHILRSFFQRYHELEPAARQELALRLAGQFFRKTGYHPGSPVSDGSRAEVFLASLCRDLESLKQHGR
jgi:uncharacterized RDD family membrane protein YckC